jgi:hypothetical protein
VGLAVGRRWSDIDFARARLTPRLPRVAVNYQVHESDTKTPSGRRSLALDPATLEALSEHRLLVLLAFLALAYLAYEGISGGSRVLRSVVVETTYGVPVLVFALAVVFFISRRTTQDVVTTLAARFPWPRGCWTGCARASTCSRTRSWPACRPRRSGSSGWSPRATPTVRSPVSWAWPRRRSRTTSSILAKLEVARRAEAAAYLARNTTLPGN